MIALLTTMFDLIDYKNCEILYCEDSAEQKEDLFLLECKMTLRQQYFNRMCGLFLTQLGGNLPYLDSTSTVLSVVAQILCVRRYREQWLMWIVVNVVTIVMWGAAFWSGGESVVTLLMWNVFLINAVIMYRKWSKEAEK